MLCRVLGPSTWHPHEDVLSKQGFEKMPRGETGLPDLDRPVQDVVVAVGEVALLEDRVEGLVLLHDEIR